MDSLSGISSLDLCNEARTTEAKRLSDDSGGSLNSSRFLTVFFVIRSLLRYDGRIICNVQ